MNISISNLHFTYPNGIQVLRGLSLEIASGANVVLLGQNGAGKTTLVKHLNALLLPTQGTVKIGDWDTREHTIAQLSRRVGFVFQNPDDQLFKTRVEDEIAFGPTNLKIEPAEITARVDHALELCGLTDLRDVHPYDLPPWQRRWVAIASVVAMQTPIVILDEPTTGQDAAGLERLSSLFQEWSRAKTTVITVTHDIDFASEQSDDLIIMAQGDIIARGSDQIFSDESLLNRAALTAPQLIRLSRALGWQATPSRVDEFVDYLAAQQSPS